MEHKKSKLTLKGIDESTGIPFIKGIHSLDEVKTSGTYIVIARNATSEENGFPKIHGKTDCCFCCEANLVVNCCYNDDESQSTNTYGQELTISDKENNTTGTYKRTVGPAGCSEWLMVATGDIKLIAQNNDIVKAYNEVSANLNAALERIDKAEDTVSKSHNTVLESATVRFDRIEENEATINAGEIGNTPSAIVYYKPANKFVAADSAGAYWDTWDGMEAYMSGGAVRKDKVYLCDENVLVWYANALSSPTLEEQARAETVEMQLQTDLLKQKRVNIPNIITRLKNGETVIVSEDNVNTTPGYYTSNGTLNTSGFKSTYLYVENIKNISFQTTKVADVPIVVCYNNLGNSIAYYSNSGSYRVPSATTRISINFFGKEYATEITLTPLESAEKNKYRLLLCNISTEKPFITRKDKKLFFNTFKSPLSPSYSNIVLYHDNRLHFTNIRADNVLLEEGYSLILSKSPTNIDRFADVSELPYGSSDANAYLVPVGLSPYAESWDILYANAGGVAVEFMNTSNISILDTPSFEYSNVRRYKYGHSLKKPYNFKGQTAIFFGDSVTWGVSTNPWTSPLNECYRNLFCQYAGLTHINAAVSGSFVYDTDYDGETPKTSSILSQVQTLLKDDSFKFIFIAGGVNDFWTGKALGSIIDEGNVSFYGALKEICNHIKSVAPTANVIFLTPINYSRIGGVTGFTPTSYLDDYRNAIFEVAVMNGFSVVDTSVIGFPFEIEDTEYRTSVIADGVHPTALGHKMMAENLYSILGE